MEAGVVQAPSPRPSPSGRGSEGIIGRSVPRHDSYQAVTGTLQHTEDIHLPGMLHCRFLRARYPHATIVRIDTSRALVAPGVAAVITAGDVPHNRLGPRQQHRVLADDRVRYLGDPVAAVAAEKYLAEKV